MNGGRRSEVIRVERWKIAEDDFERMPFPLCTPLRLGRRSEL